jgi:hypothetical protein
MALRPIKTGKLTTAEFTLISRIIPRQIVFR